MRESRHTTTKTAAGTPPDWTVHTVRPLPALLNEAKDLVIAELHERLGQEGFPEVRPGHGRVIRFIEPEGSRLTDVAEQAGLTKQAAGEVISDLESLGHLERFSCPDDGRAKIIRLTDRGRACVATAERIFADIESRWASQFGERRVATLRAVLEEVTKSARAEPVPS
jgi:DNA-binding MarR family transcriptional regulator